MKETGITTNPNPAGAPSMAIQTAAPAPATSALGQVTPSARAKKTDVLPLRALKILADLRITVVLFVLSFLLVFLGTLAQVDAGIWTVVNKYFRSDFVWIPFQVLFPRNLEVSGGFPFPGGWLLGGCLLANLLAAHAVRFKVNWKRSGILLIHAGLIVMMVSEVVTGKLAIEGNITIPNGGSSNFIDHQGTPELVIIDPSNPKADEVVAIPERLLRRKGELIQHELLPFGVKVDEFMANSGEPRPTLELTAPAAWTVLTKAGPMNLHAFQAGDPKAGTVSITVSMAGGSLLENVNRWGDQIGLPPVKDEQLGKLDKVAIAGLDAHLVDLVNLKEVKAKGNRIIGAILRRGGTQWFFKMMGPDELVGEQKQAFDQFLKSLTFKATPATDGDGLNYVALPKPEVSGTDPDQKVDLASAYVTFKKKSGEVLGTFLVSTWFSALSDRPQMVTVDGKTYHVYLRFKRTYKPYRLHLINFAHEKFPGGDKPRKFSSLVRLVDPERNEDREILIEMNAPLRYAGETFYQASFLPGDEGTILQVVRNPGWLMPYISCAMVSIGMLIHFGMHLISFLQLRTPQKVGL